jgi:hypothetical protein
VNPRPGSPLRVTLVFLALARLIALLHPSMFAWGLNAGRFVAPPAAGALWLALALPLIPSIGRRLDAALDSLVAFLAGHGVSPALAAAAAAAALVLAFPDHTWFVGDFVLREGIVHETNGFRQMFPQTQPLDVLLHWSLPRALLARGIDPNLTARVLGALEAGSLVLLGARFARGFGASGALAGAIAGTIACGGYLALATGYAKPTLDVCVLAVAIGVFGLEAVRDGRGFLAVSLAFAAALALHRSALGLLPGVLAIGALAAARDPSRLRRPEFAAAAAVLLATLGWFVPRLWQLFVSFDARTNFASFEVRQQGGLVASAIRPLRLLDLANLVALLAPLAFCVPALLPPRGAPRRDERLALAALAAGLAPALLLVYVTQGPFRDWDANAAAGAALAMLAAAGLVAGFHSGAGRGLAGAALIGVLAPTVTVMVSQNDLHRGLARARAFLDEAPRRTESQRLATLDFLGLRLLRLERWSESGDAFAALAERAPHPRALVLQGTADLMSGRDAEAQRAFSTLLARDSTQSMGWFGLWLAARGAGDSLAERTAGRVVQSYTDTGPQMEAILAHLQHYPGLWELVAEARGPGRTGPARAGPAGH